MTTEDQNYSEFQVWWDSDATRSQFHPDRIARAAWQASRRTYRASVLEEAAQRLDELFYYSASAVVRALEGGTQEGQEP